MDKQLTNRVPMLHDFAFPEIPENVVRVIKKITQAGFTAYLVGGCVRDRVLQLRPKDFDVATSASPEEIKNIFDRRASIIGRRFRIVSVHAGNYVVEVTTFRGAEDTRKQVLSDDGQILVDNSFGTMEEDAFRRDLTINALYYDLKDKKIIDYVGGYEDALQRRLRLIGKPLQRFVEDPARMLRCIRFAAKLRFALPDALHQLIRQNRMLIAKVSPARLLNEFLKLTLNGAAEKGIKLCRETQLLEVMFPGSSEVLQGFDRLAQQSGKLLTNALQNTDHRFQHKERVSQFYIICVLLWPLVRNCLNDAPTNYQKLQQLGIRTVNDVNCIRIPRSFSLRIQEVWLLQLKMQYPQQRSVYRTLESKNFRAAFDLLQLREKSGELGTTLVSDWWRRVQKLDKKGVNEAIRQLPRVPRVKYRQHMSYSLFDPPSID